MIQTFVLHHILGSDEEKSYYDDPLGELLGLKKTWRSLLVQEDKDDDMIPVLEYSSDPSRYNLGYDTNWIYDN